MSASLKKTAMFPESPHVAVQGALRNAKSRAQIDGVAVNFAEETVRGGAAAQLRNRVEILTRGRRGYLRGRAFEDVHQWVAGFPGIFMRARVTFMTLRFDPAASEPIPNLDAALISATAAATRRLENAAMMAAFDDDGGLGETLTFSFLVDANPWAVGDDGKPSLSFQPEPGRRLGPARMIGEVGRWWNDIEAWRRGVSFLQIMADFEIRSMHEAAALRAEAARAGAPAGRGRVFKGPRHVS